MKTITIPMYVYFNKFSWEAKGEYVAYSFKAPDSESLTFVNQQDVQYTVPEKYNPTAQKIAALEAKKEKAQADFTKLVFEINELISKLQALEFTK